MEGGLLLIGGGGHCRSVIDVLERTGLPIAGIVQGEGCLAESVFNYPTLGQDADLNGLRSRYTQALVTVGQIKSPEIRIRLFCLLCDLGFQLPVIVSPLARVSPHAQLGAGTIVMHHAMVNAGAVVGENCIINTIR